MRRMIDGHLDLSWNALSWGRDITLDLDELNRSEAGMDGPSRAGAGDDDPAGDAAGRRSRSARRRCWPGPSPRSAGPRGMSRLSLDYANQEIASATARGQLAYYELLERRGLLRMIRSAGDLESHWERLGATTASPSRSATSWPWRGPTRSSSPARRSSGGTSACAR